MKKVIDQHWYFATQSLQPTSGFSLIELLISVFIISLLLGIAFANFSGFNQRQRLISTGQTMKNILRDVQSRAFNGEMDCSVNACDCQSANGNALQGWYADFTTNKTYGICKNASNAQITIFPKDFALPTMTQITPILNPDPGVAPKLVRFRYFPPGTDQSADICLQDSGLGNGSYYKVHIDASGTITDSGAIDATCP